MPAEEGSPATLNILAGTEALRDMKNKRRALIKDAELQTVASRASIKVHLAEEMIVSSRVLFQHMKDPSSCMESSYITGNINQLLGVTSIEIVFFLPDAASLLLIGRAVGATLPPPSDPSIDVFSGDLETLNSTGSFNSSGIEAASPFGFRWYHGNTCDWGEPNKGQI
ncbi:hypothetical protein BDZ45DRAFT_678146 [Acephala macrosclerotiorum]|nr:hypothetical protein BDZ45DRAFT_678146 [Acephala macrosclerotiorum]